MKKRLKGTVIYSLSNILLKLGSAAMLPILTRLLTPDEFGVIAILTPLTSILAILLGGGLYSPLMKKYIDLQEKPEVFARYACSFLFVIALLSVLLCTLFHVSLIYWDFKSLLPSQIEVSYIEFSLYIAVFSALNTISICLFRIQDKYIYVSFIALLSFISNYFITIWLLSEFDLGVLGYLIGSLISSVFIFIFNLKNYAYKMKFNINLSYIISGFKHGVPLVFIELSDWFIGLSDRFVLMSFVSLVEVGVYSLAATGAKIIGVLGSSYNNTIISELYGAIRDGKDQKIIISELVEFYKVLVALAVSIQLTSFEIIPFIFPATYENLGFYFISLIPCAILQYFFFLDFYFHYHEKSKVIAKITVFIAILNLCMNLFLVPIFGVLAAIYTTFFAFTIRLVLQVILINRLFNIKFNLSSICILTSFLFVIPALSNFIELEESILVRWISSILMVMFSIWTIKKNMECN